MNEVKVAEVMTAMLWAGIVIRIMPQTCSLEMGPTTAIYNPNPSCTRTSLTLRTFLCNIVEAILAPIMLHVSSVFYSNIMGLFPSLHTRLETNFARVSLRLLKVIVCMCAPSGPKWTILVHLVMLRSGPEQGVFWPKPSLDHSEPF